MFQSICWHNEHVRIDLVQRDNVPLNQLSLPNSQSSVFVVHDENLKLIIFDKQGQWARSRPVLRLMTLLWQRP